MCINDFNLEALERFIMLVMGAGSVTRNLTLASDNNYVVKSVWWTVFPDAVRYLDLTVVLSNLDEVSNAGHLKEFI